MIPDRLVHIEVDGAYVANTAVKRAAVAKVKQAA